MSFSNKHDRDQKNCQNLYPTFIPIANNKQNGNHLARLGFRKNSLYPISEDSESLINLHLENAKYKLNSLQSAGIICIIENCLDQLAIIGYLNSAANPISDNELQHSESTYKVDKFQKGLFNKDAVELLEKTVYKQNKNKLQRDRNYIEQILKSTLKELIYSSSFKHLVNKIQDVDFTNKEESNLFLEEYENCVEIKQLKDSIINEELKSKQEFRECDIHIDELKDKYEDIVLENAIKKNYIYNWENARNEQNKLRCKLIEKKLQKSLQQTKMDIEQEMRCSSEIDNYMEQFQKDLNNSIHFWMKKYDKDVEKIDKDILILQGKTDSLQPEIQATVNITAYHRTEMDKYLAEKARRAQEEALVVHKKNCAVRIQSWWRGVMVRRCLGEYRKIKKGAVKDKGGKKKKK